MGVAPHSGSGGLNSADKETVKNWMVAGHSVQNGKIAGTVPDKGAVSLSVGPGDSVSIPAGYHNGSGKVTGKSYKIVTRDVYAYDNSNWSGNTFSVNYSDLGLQSTPIVTAAIQWCRIYIGNGGRDGRLEVGSVSASKTSASVYVSYTRNDADPWGWGVRVRFTIIYFA